MDESTIKHGETFVEDYLAHYGVLGMRWGHRSRSTRVRSRQQLTTSRQIKDDKRVLDQLNKGKHKSFAFTKKRQALYDERDKKQFADRIKRNEAYLNPEKGQKGKRIAGVILRGMGGKLAVHMVASGLAVTGKEKAAKALYNVGAALIDVKTVADVYAVAKSKNE